MPRTVCTTAPLCAFELIGRADRATAAGERRSASGLVHSAWMADPCDAKSLHAGMPPGGSSAGSAVSAP
jgi:hypothetical protein